MTHKPETIACESVSMVMRENKLKFLVIAISMFAILGSAFAQDSTGTKISKAFDKSAHKVSSYSKKESKGFNHAVQRTDKRYAKAEDRKQDKNTQISGHSHMTAKHTVRHTKKRHYKRRRHAVKHTTPMKRTDPKM
jgi:hypothetical protein